MTKSKSGYIYIILCTLIFSMVEVVLKTVQGVFAPLQINALRFFFGGLTLLPFALRSVRRKGTRLGFSDLRFFLLMGLLFIPITMSIYQLSVELTRASAVAVIFSCNPIFIVVLAYFVLHEELHYNHIIALVIELIAIVIIVDPLHNAIAPLGALFAILSALLFSVYSVIGKTRTARYGGIAVTCFSFICGATEQFILLLLGRIPAVSAFLRSVGLGVYADVPLFENIPASALPALVYICAVNTGLGFVCHMLAMEKTSAKEASLVFFFKPMLAPIFALIFLKEAITLNMAIGIFLFMVGAGFSVLPGLIAEKRAQRLQSK